MADSKAHAQSDQTKRDRKIADADADNNLGRGAPADREERIQQKERGSAQSLDRDPQYREREAHDLDREDCEIHREGIADEQPGIRLSKEEAKSSDKG